MELQRNQFIDKIKIGKTDENLDNIAVKPSKLQQSFMKDTKSFEN
jgi:hypothetical protein